MRGTRRDPGVGRSATMLVLLTAVFALNILDRQILSILVEPIKHDLHLSDVQVGLLTGLAFSLVYSTLALAIARLADRGNRAAIIAVSIAIWSGMTVLCGAAASFPALLAGRMGVAVGEAGCTPASISLLADYFPPHKRAFTIAVTQAGGVVGAGIALLFGGIVAQACGWRAPLVAIGVFGLLLAGVVALVLKDPRWTTRASRESGAARPFAIPLRKAVTMIVGRPGLGWLILGGMAGGYGNFALLSWMPSFFQRVHGWSAGTTGSALAIVVVGGGIVGALATGRLADRRLAHDPGAHCAVPALGLVIALPVLLVALLSRNALVALAGFAVLQLLNNGWQPGSFATVQTMMDARTRASAAALLGLAVNLVGLGLGPLVTGALSDRLMPGFGHDSLRYALLPTVACYALAALAFNQAARRLR